MVAQETLDTCEENQTGDNTIQGYGLHNGLKMASFHTKNRALDHQTIRPSLKIISVNVNNCLLQIE